MRTALRKMGNSTGIILPRAILDQLGLGSEGRLELVVEGGRVIATPVTLPVRSGWAEDAQRLAAVPVTGEEQDWDALDAGDDADWQW